jgi:micrococcal nuclease
MNGHADLRLKSKLYYYAALVTEVYDGDTLTVDLDLGLGMWRRGQRIRLWKLNAPELHGSERERGLVVRDFVRARVLGKTVLVRTILDKRGVDSTEKFGRLLGEILLEDETGAVLNLNEHLLASGLVRPLDAGGSAVSDGPSASPMPPGAEMPGTIPCRYCGETRRVDHATNLVAECPNCLDAAYLLFPITQE